jgi:hypothetical protein
MSNIREVEFGKPKNAPNAEIIKILEEWLDRAKSGELAAVAIAGARSDGGQTTEFNSGTNSHLTLNSAIATLAFRYGKKIHDGD